MHYCALLSLNVVTVVFSKKLLYNLKCLIFSAAIQSWKLNLFLHYQYKDYFINWSVSYVLKDINFLQKKIIYLTAFLDWWQYIIGVLNPGVVFLCFVTEDFILFLAPVGALIPLLFYRSPSLINSTIHYVCLLCLLFHLLGYYSYFYIWEFATYGCCFTSFFSFWQQIKTVAM